MSLTIFSGSYDLKRAYGAEGAPERMYALKGLFQILSYDELWNRPLLFFALFRFAVQQGGACAPGTEKSGLYPRFSSQVARLR